MNTFEVVMLSSDTNIVPVKYGVMECTVGSTIAATNLWLKCISYGVASQENLDSIANQMNFYDKTLLVGTPGSYVVTTLNNVKPYNRRADVKIPQVNVQIG